MSQPSSDNLISEQQFELKVLEGNLDDIEIIFEGPEFIKFAHLIEGDKLITKMSVTEKNYGEHEGKIIIYHNEIRYVVPFLLHYTQGSISVNQQNDKLIFDNYHPEELEFCKNFCDK